MRKYLIAIVASISLLLFSFEGNAQAVYYVEDDGLSANSGLDIGDPTDFASAVTRANVPGDIVYIKKGTYPRTSTITFSNSGTSVNPIQFIGYNVTPGDLNTAYLSYGVTRAGTNFPIIDGPGNTSGVHAFFINGNYLVFQNILLYDFNIGWLVNGSNNLFDNIAFFELGHQSDPSNAFYTGFGIRIVGNGNIVQNSYGQNVNAEAYMVRGNNNQIINNEYHNNNASSQTDYYMTVRATTADNGAFNIFEDNRIYRYHNGTHTGHGYDIKSGNNNIFRDNYAYRTKLEVNFSNTFDNLFRRNIAEGTSARIHVSNGAHDNIFDGNRIYDTGYQGIVGFMYDDGAASTPIDCNCIGDDNIFINNIIAGSPKAIQMQEAAADIVGTTPVKGWIFKNNIFYGNTQGGLRTNIDIEDFVFENNIWMNQTNSGAVSYSSGSSGTNITFNKENYYNNSFATPSGAGFTNITSHNPLFTNAATKDFTLQAGSSLINLGATTAYTNDIIGTVRPQGAGFDIGAFEYIGTPPTDTTPPSLVSVTVDNITDVSFRADWTLNEGSKGQIYFDTNTGTNIGDYPNSGALENGFLLRHVQTIGNSNPFPLTPATTYYWRIYMEDAAGNDALSAEQTTTTLGDGETPPPDPDPEINFSKGIKKRFFKFKKGN